MKFGKLKEVTGSWMKQTVKWLEESQEGCCSLCFAQDDVNNYAVCVGWHDEGPERIAQPDGTFKDVPGDDGWRIAWMIGRQSHNNIMQCDFDIDFEMPCDPETGDVDDTIEVIEVVKGKPKGYGSWAELAAYVRKIARRVWNDWKEISDGEE